MPSLHFSSKIIGRNEAIKLSFLVISSAVERHFLLLTTHCHPELVEGHYSLLTVISSAVERHYSQLTFHYKNELHQTPHRIFQ